MDQSISRRSLIKGAGAVAVAGAAASALGASVAGRRRGPSFAAEVDVPSFWPRPTPSPPTRSPRAMTTTSW